MKKRMLALAVVTALCLGCLHRCPRFAIQDGRHTKEHGQYTNPNVTI